MLFMPIFVQKFVISIVIYIMGGIFFIRNLCVLENNSTLQNMYLKLYKNMYNYHSKLETTNPESKIILSRVQI